MIMFALACSASFAEPTNTTRIDATIDGLQRYFTAAGGYLNSCGATGGLGGGSAWECTCEKTHTPFCTNCWRWWMAGALQALVDLNNATAHHPSQNATTTLLDSCWMHSPYTSRYFPTWAYIDDYLWYTLLWLRVHQTREDANETRYLDEATATFDLMAQWGVDEPCGGIFWMYPDGDVHGARKNAITTLEAVSVAAQLSVAHRATDQARATRHEEQVRICCDRLPATGRTPFCALVLTAPLHWLARRIGCGRGYRARR